MKKFGVLASSSLLALGLAVAAPAAEPAYNLDGPIGGFVVGLSDAYVPSQTVYSVGGNYGYDYKNSTNNVGLMAEWVACSHATVFGGFSQSEDHYRYDYVNGHSSAYDYYSIYYNLGVVIRPFGGEEGTGLVEKLWLPAVSISYMGGRDKTKSDNGYFGYQAHVLSLLPGALVVSLGYSDMVGQYYSGHTTYRDTYTPNISLGWRLGDVFGSKEAPANQLASGWLPSLNYTHQWKTDNQYSTCDNLSLYYCPVNFLGLTLGVDYNRTLHGDLSTDTKQIGYQFGAQFNI